MLSVCLKRGHENVQGSTLNPHVIERITEQKRDRRTDYREYKLFHRQP